MGDDDGDIELLQEVGVSACPQNASENVKRVCEYVSDRDGGDGAIRSIVEWLIEKNRI